MSRPTHRRLVDPELPCPPIRPGRPLAARGYRRVIAPPRMQNAGDCLTDVGFRPEGNAMVRDLA
jgi:hypothetical protein